MLFLLYVELHELCKLTRWIISRLFHVASQTWCWWPHNLEGPSLCTFCSWKLFRRNQSAISLTLIQDGTKERWLLPTISQLISPLYDRCLYLWIKSILMSTPKIDFYVEYGSVKSISHRICSSKIYFPSNRKEPLL